MPHTNSRQRSALRSARKQGAPSKKPAGKFGSRPPLAVYDESARHQYLTGFSARKKAAKAAAQERAADRAREEKLEFRRQLKAARLAKVKETIDEQAEWYGVDAFSSIQTDQLVNPQTETFIEESEDQLLGQTNTTVTVEPMEIDHSVLLDSAGQRVASTLHQNRSHPSTNFAGNSSSRTTSAPNVKKPKKKIGKIPYESKATRTIDRAKKQRKRDSKSQAKTQNKRSKKG